MGTLISPEKGHLLQFSFIVFNSVVTSVSECVCCNLDEFYQDLTGVGRNWVFFL